MKKILLFFSKPIVGGLLSLIGLLEILFSIPSSYITYPIPLWIIVLAIGLVILLPYLWKRLKILYYIRNYTSDSFGGSCLYKWCWTKTSDKFNVYGYFPIRIDVVENVKLDPNIPVFDCAHHYIHNENLLAEYIMICLYHKVENTKQTNLFVQQLHSLEAHYSSQNRR